MSDPLHPTSIKSGTNIEQASQFMNIFWILDMPSDVLVPGKMWLFLLNLILYLIGH